MSIRSSVLLACALLSISNGGVLAVCPWHDKVVPDWCDPDDDDCVKVNKVKPDYEGRTAKFTGTIKGTSPIGTMHIILIEKVTDQGVVGTELCKAGLTFVGSPLPNCRKGATIDFEAKYEDTSLGLVPDEVASYSCR